jgi:phosphotransferase system HPr-like phosphotransfer protein
VAVRVDAGPSGLHARSAAYLIRWTANLNARIHVRRLSDGEELVSCRPARAGNFLRLSAFATGSGGRDGLEITAIGPDSQKALA